MMHFEIDMEINTVSKETYDASPDQKTNKRTCHQKGVVFCFVFVSNTFKTYLDNQKGPRVGIGKTNTLRKVLIP